MTQRALPPTQGLYDPRNEHDACGFGFVCDIKGRRSHDIVEKALTVLVNLEHRGAAGSEKNSGDGAGLLCQLPHAFLERAAGAQGVKLPAPGHYAVGMVYLPQLEATRRACERMLEEVATEEGQAVLGWRDVPTENGSLGASARASQPAIRQFFVGRGEGCPDEASFERKLYVIRRMVEKRVGRSALQQRDHFYVPSLSCKTIVYKGMLNAGQLVAFYPDLSDPAFASAIAMVHSRFSTNTFPSWSRAHPYRYISHNGEINTLRGNINWMHARQSMMASHLFGDDLKKILTVIDLEGSDSAMFDNVLELLHLAGRSLPHAMMMMVPEPYARHETMSPEKKAFYEFHSCLMEPWDGPASIAFTDGVVVGATLDRNGLRPARYYVTKDGLVVMASEVGVLDLPPDRIVEKGRLRPGRMFLVDTAEQRIVADEELKRRIAGEQPYARWLSEHLVRLEDLPKPDSVFEPDHETVLRRQEAFGYSAEDVRILIAPMAETGVEPIGSMGNDTPLAVLSEKPQILYNYFKQLFAQVTNPPIDAIREEIVMAVETATGPEGNLLEPAPASAHQLALPTPVLRNEELEKIRRLDGKDGSRGFKTITLPMLFKVRDGGAGLRKAIEDLRWTSSEAIGEGRNIIILSDRGHDEEYAPIPALLAVAAVQHHLLREGTRTRVGIVLETGRAARGAPLRAAHRLRGERREPLPRLRDPPRPDPDGDDQGPARRRREAVRQGGEQGHREGDLQDGDLHHPELPRRPGVRGHRPQPGLHRRVLHLDPHPHRRRRHRRGGEGGEDAARPRLPAQAARRAQAARHRRPVPVPQRRRAAPLQPAHHPQAAVRLPHGQLRALQGVRAAHRRPVADALHAARAHGLQARPHARCPSRRWSRSRPS